MQRLFDLIVTVCFLMVTAPLILVIAILIKLDSPGPVFYSKRCIGKNGKPFDLLYLRTMRDDGATHLSAAARLTRVGRFIRNYSLDHLAILFNILKGEMSIVGPRAEFFEYVDLNDSDWRKILSVRPGLISLAVLKLAKNYNASSQSARKQIELEYIQKRSFAFDLKIIGKGIQALIASRGNVKARGVPSAR